LGLDGIPIGVKIVKTEESLPDINLPTQNSCYCQLMLTRKGQTLMLNAEKYACIFKKESTFSPPKSLIIRKRR
jgi:hypothetical protein